MHDARLEYIYNIYISPIYTCEEEKAEKAEKATHSDTAAAADVAAGTTRAHASSEFHHSGDCLSSRR